MDAVTTLSTKTQPYWLNELDRDLILKGFEALSLVLDDNKDKAKFRRMRIVVNRLDLEQWAEG